MRQTQNLTEGSSVRGGDDFARFAEALPGARMAGHVVGLTPEGVGEPLLRREAADGDWVVGRYAGELRLDGERLGVDPAIGWPAFTRWVEAATELHASSAALAETSAPILGMTALVWARAVDGASRHGPPAFRRDVLHVGGSVRGHLDVRRTVRLRAKGASGAASIYRSRDLDNPVTRIIVAADRVLTRHVGRGRWRTDRVEGILPQLYTAVGRRSPVPGDGELHRMRYTPITRPFKWAAELSSLIVHQDPVATTPLPGRPQGLLLDLEGIWAGAVLAWARQARPDLRADIEDLDQIVVRDTETVRATLTTDAGACDGLGPVVRVAAFGTPRRVIQLPADAAAAATAIREVLATV